jgi:hypothetical protein
MPINVDSPEDIASPRAPETPLETAARLREKHGIVLGRKARKPLARAVFDDMWGDDTGNSARRHSTRRVND